MGTSNGANISPVLRATYGKLIVEKVFVSGESTATNIALINIGVEGEVEVLEWVARDAGKFTLIDIADATGKATLHKVDIETDQADWGYLANLNEDNGTCTIKSATMNRPGADVDLILDAGPTATVLADWRVTDQAYDGSAYNLADLPTVLIAAAGEYTIDIGNCIAPEIFVNLICSAPGGLISAISPGKFYGQRIVLQNKYDTTNNGTQTCSLRDSIDGKLRVGPSDVDITVGAGATLCWLDKTWRRVG